MPISNDEFRAALGNFASGVNVVTTKDADGKMHGITVSAFCSVSLEPPLVLICVEKKAASHDAFVESEIFVVNTLSETQIDLSERFAASISDKFEAVDYHIGNLGVPVLTGSLVNLECRLRHTLNGGDHSIFVGEVEYVQFNDVRPLVYFRGEYQKLSN